MFEEILQIKTQSVLMVDNEAAIRLAQNPEFHNRTKHIHLRHFFVREMYTNGLMDVRKVSSACQIADVMTKPLFKPRYDKLLTYMGMDKS